MNKLTKYLKYIFNISAFVFFVVYLVIKTPDLKTSISVVLGLYILLGSMFIWTSFFRDILHQGTSIKMAIFQNKLSLILLIAAGIFLYLLKGWGVFSALMSGSLLFMIFYFFLFFFTRTGRYKNQL